MNLLEARNFQVRKTYINCLKLHYFFVFLYEIWHLSKRFVGGNIYGSQVKKHGVGLLRHLGPQKSSSGTCSDGWFFPHRKHPIFFVICFQLLFMEFLHYFVLSTFPVVLSYIFLSPFLLLTPTERTRINAKVLKKFREMEVKGKGQASRSFGHLQ